MNDLNFPTRRPVIRWSTALDNNGTLFLEDKFLHAHGNYSNYRNSVCEAKMKLFVRREICQGIPAKSHQIFDSQRDHKNLTLHLDSNLFS